MTQNTIQFQKGMSLPDFLKDYGTEEQCEQALEQWRWPLGFSCPRCGRPHEPVRLRTRALLQCRHCHHQASLTAGTIFEATKLALTTWFLAMFLLTQQKNGISALALKRHLGVAYLTAWRIKHTESACMTKISESGATVSESRVRSIIVLPSTNTTTCVRSAPRSSTT